MLDAWLSNWKLPFRTVFCTGQIDLKQWDQSFRKHYSLVALDDGKIVGFGDINETGYLDRLYVHADYQGEGITLQHLRPFTYCTSILIQMIAILHQMYYNKGSK